MRGGARFAAAALLAAVVLACTAVPPSAVPSASGPVASAAAVGTASAGASGPLPANAFQILHTNDIHGRLDSASVVTGAGAVDQGGMALLAGMIDRERARAPERTLLLDGGDAWVGQLISAIDHGRAVVQAMSMIGYDAMALGNHDFDWGQDELLARAKEATFPFLAANLVAEATGAVPAFAKPYIVKDVGVAKVGIIGLTYPSASIIKAASVKGLRFLPAVDSVKKVLPEVKAKADVIVVLSHLGIEGGTARIGGGDTALAEAVPDIDVIVGAHDHLAFNVPRVVGRTRILQAASYAQDLGRVAITVDPATRKVTGVQNAAILLPVLSNAATPDPKVAALVSARRAAADAVGKTVVGTAAGELEQSREMDSPLGNVVADALLDYGREQGWKSDVAFYNGAGIRASIPKGDFTYAKLAEVLPFQNTVVSVDLTGAALREVLEGMAGSAGRLFMSGGTMRYRFANPPGKRVLDATVGGAPIDPARVYHVATIDYLLGGGDGHAEFAKGTNVVYGDLDVEVVAAYAKAHSPLPATSPGRVTQE